MNRRDAAVLAAMQQLTAHMDARLDAITARIDTAIDAIAGLRVDLATHDHDD